MQPRILHTQAGFTLLEVLVALIVVGTALGASLRAVGSLTQNSSGLRASMMATWSAENRLAEIRLRGDYPAIGRRNFACPQGELPLTCEEEVFSTPNPFFRRVEVTVYNEDDPGRQIIKLAQIVSSRPSR
ncbi:type II secretion system minor pseudopilin GspI [Noviherbaspirillum sp.]|uniref:type II secretion system minor pseudopilin GspI n=1 Tax=Noviherbaspirillum sp. TaxID=1926288 RepID=UPI002D6EF970|nr:type II secretion system minor pseudopilin GspI [Noviherbaspirillum sp.]HZW21909.1 type II secretion system minor pseudopilin GspI [Noviherbaspirillum sp.]